ncbi:Zinc finger and BTB domain-containing protein 17 [Papilio xuthus]|uniref:Zinc finger and BTB domain-containing protein 17 n=1 Tax=Papilio xuthus TaxID=66420 RepID=A0A0N0P9L6_PAPXU|nr:Zinc finger and BTB domain-containing protein 17 [Papilio xuthus]
MDTSIDESKKIIKIQTPKKIDPQLNLSEESTLIFLKEPISIDEIGNGTRLSFRDQTLKTVTTLNVSRRKRNDKSLIWIRNALTIFEFSYVYPFIYARNKYKCYTCSKEFVDSQILREHSLKTHNIEELRLELNKKSQDNNLKVDIFQIKCKLCQTTLKNLNDLKFHLKDHGKDIDPSYQDNIIPFKLEGNTYNCQICGENYYLMRLLIIHMSKHFNNYSCEICGNVFVSKLLLNRHLQVHKKGSYQCEKCDKVFDNSAKRINHIRSVHLKQRVRTCPLCPERFGSYYQRNKHLRISHDQTTRYRCETCGGQFYLKYQLFLHKRSVHMQERNEECTICQFRFFSKSSLARHMVTHSDKSFKCDVCGKAYSRRKNLREHTKTHELVEASYVCDRLLNNQPTLMADVNKNDDVI